MDSGAFRRCPGVIGKYSKCYLIIKIVLVNLSGRGDKDLSSVFSAKGWTE